MGDFDSRNLPPHIARRIAEADARARRGRDIDGPVSSVQPDPPPKRSKYGNRKSKDSDGHTIDSQREVRLLQQLELRKAAGEIALLLRQVPFHLPGGVRYIADALVLTTDRELEVWDAKGVRTAIYTLKRKQVEEIYGVKIREF